MQPDRSVPLRPLYLGLAALVGTGLDAAGQLLAVVVAAAFAAAPFLATGRQRLPSAVALFGFLVPLSPLLGNQTLLCLGLLFLALRPSPAGLQAYRWALPFLLVIGSWAVWNVFWELDPHLVAALVRGSDGPGAAGLPNLLRWLQSDPPWVRPLEGWARLLLLVALMHHFGAGAQAREGFRKGLLAGLLPAALLALWQLFGAPAVLFRQHTELWRSLGRFPATFTDPNAFGIFLVLAAPLAAVELARRRGAVRLAVAGGMVLWGVLGTFSGSRSFFLGLLLYATLLLWRLRPRLLLTGALLLLFLIVAINGLALWHGATELPGRDSLPVGLQRIGESLLLGRVSEAVFSRVAFMKIAVFMWLDHAALGVGFLDFSSWVPVYSERLDLRLGAWSDNPNNFYLGVLAVLGLLGALALGLSLSRLSWRASASPDLAHYRPAVLCLAALLLLGPHLVFDEVAVLTAFLFAATLRVKPRRETPYLALAAAALLLLLIGLKASRLEHGFYDWNLGSAGFYRWSARQARGFVPCDDGGNARLGLRALTPGLAADPVQVHLRLHHGESRAIHLTSRDLRWLHLRCPERPQEAREPGLLYYDLEVSRIWTPESYGAGEDPRALGVQVFSPQIARHRLGP